MSLADLRKNKHLPKQQKVTVDDFIDAATTYSLGGTSTKKTIITSEKLTKRANKKLREQRVKRTTFSLTEATIASLNQLSAECKMSESKLIRIMIENIDASTIKVWNNS